MFEVWLMNDQNCSWVCFQFLWFAWLFLSLFCTFCWGVVGGPRTLWIQFGKPTLNGSSTTKHFVANLRLKKAGSNHLPSLVAFAVQLLCGRASVELFTGSSLRPRSVLRQHQSQQRRQSNLSACMIPKMLMACKLSSILWPYAPEIIRKIWLQWAVGYQRATWCLRLLPRCRHKASRTWHHWWWKWVHPLHKSSCSIIQLFSRPKVSKNVVWFHRNHFCSVGEPLLRKLTWQDRRSPHWRDLQICESWQPEILVVEWSGLVVTGHCDTCQDKNPRKFHLKSETENCSLSVWAFPVDSSAER